MGVLVFHAKCSDDKCKDDTFWRRQNVHRLYLSVGYLTEGHPKSTQMCTTNLFLSSFFWLFFLDFVCNRCSAAGWIELQMSWSNAFEQLATACLSSVSRFLRFGQPISPAQSGDFSGPVRRFLRLSQAISPVQSGDFSGSVRRFLRFSQAISPVQSGDCLNKQLLV